VYIVLFFFLFVSEESYAFAGVFMHCFLSFRKNKKVILFHLLVKQSPVAMQGIRPGPRPLLNVRNKLIFYGEELLAPRQTPKLEDHPCRLSATTYSIYSQLPSITGGRVLHPQPEDAPCRGDKGPTLTSLNDCLLLLYYYYYYYCYHHLLNYSFDFYYCCYFIIIITQTI
jgi:hypothetical protein